MYVCMYVCLLACWIIGLTGERVFCTGKLLGCIYSHKIGAMGLIESSCLAPGGKSVECLRGELMNYLKSLACNLELGDKTVEQHITSRLVDKGSVGEKSFREKIEMYSRVMLNVGGDDCFAGGELEVYLFAKTQGVNIAIYIERGDKLIRVYVNNAKGKNRPTIHLLRTLYEEDTSRHRDVETVAKLKPPTFTYTLFTPKLKSIIDRLQAFDTKDLVLLYNMVAKALPARNGWVDLCAALPPPSQQ